MQILFPHLRSFRLLSARREAKRLILSCERVRRTALCPVCGTAAHRIHSRDARTVRDLSIQNVQVILHLHVRKFYCDQPNCARRIFTERLPQVTPPHGRFSFGLRQFLSQLGREQGGASAARSAALSGVQVTERSILRFMHALPLPPIADPQIIGIDEWAWKRRERYGAIVVDLEQNRPIALLPDRSQKTVAHWLKLYPTINIVARDRSKEFAAAITEALPHAKHVADRWHLAKNLTEHLDKVVSRRWKQLTEAVDKAELPPEPHPVSSRTHQPRQPAGEARYQQVLALQKAGLPTGTIAKRLGVGQRTIQRWLAQEHGASAGARKPRCSPLDWATGYLKERWEAGEHNGTLLWEELKAQGYTGSSQSVYRRLAKWRNHPRKMGLPAAPESIPHTLLEDVTPSKVIGWMLARPGTLSFPAEAQLDQLCEMDEQLSLARELTHNFLQLIRDHSSEGLESWLKDVRTSRIREFLTFAQSRERDKTAILAGLTLPVSHRTRGRTHQPAQAHQTASVWSSWAFLSATPLLRSGLIDLASPPKVLYGRRLAVIERQAVVELLKVWRKSIGVPISCEALHEKHTAWLVTTTQGEHLVLKEVGEGHERRKLDSCYQVWLHLETCGIPVAIPRGADDGSCFVTYQDKLYTLSPYLPAVTKGGEKHGLANLDIGKAIGYLHHALADYQGEVFSWHLKLEPWVFEQTIPRLLTHLAEGEQVRLHEVLGHCSDQMRQAFVGLPEHYIHGDCHTGNLLVQDGQVVGFIDLNHLPWGPRIYDLGYLLADQIKWFTQNREQTSRWLQHFPAVLTGYEQVNSLSKPEKEALWSVLLAVQLVLSDWFSQRQTPVLAELNLEAFYWFYEHKEEIMQRLAQTLC